MSLTKMKDILAPLSSASDAMSEALQQAREELSSGIGEAGSALNKGMKQSLKNAQKSSDRATRAWYERSDMVRNRSSDAADQAALTYRHALDALSGTWNRALQAVRAAGEQAQDLDVNVRRETQRYSRQTTTWAKENPYIVAAAVAAAGYLVIRTYRKRRQRRLEAEDVTGPVGNAANDEAVHTKRSA
ncbi:MAG: hypothetical protein ABJB01_06020 [Rudaea sp.]